MIQNELSIKKLDVLKFDQCYQIKTWYNKIITGVSVHLNNVEASGIRCGPFGFFV